MYVIGLGNPGLPYKKTRHNVGFMLIDHMRPITKPKKVCNSYFYPKVSNIDGFLKPLTYMNLSGKAVKCFIDKNKLTEKDIIVCHDDVDLPLGTIRIKKSGGSGGHKGLESIIETINSDEFIRVRIGVSKNIEEDTAKYVLQEFTLNELKSLKNIFKIAKNAIYDIINIGVSKAQTKYNRRNYE